MLGSIDIPNRNSLINPLITLNDVDPDCNKNWYYEDIIGSDNLLITVGDSWTWGDSLGKINQTLNIYDDYEHRVTNIYGYHLSKLLNYDFANVAFPGGSNSLILYKLKKFLNGIKKDYEKILIVFTLTESGRDDLDFAIFHNEYNFIKGESWPEFKDLLSNKPNIKLIEECTKNNMFFIESYMLNQALKNFSNTTDFFRRYEAWTFNMITRVLDNVNFQNLNYLIGRNFTHTISENRHILGDRLLENLWVDVISNRGHIDPYPKDIYTMSTIGTSPIDTFMRDFPGHKEMMVEILTNSTKGIDWLINSPYNSKIATKHPKEIAHQWWAEYLYEEILKREIL